MTETLTATMNESATAPALPMQVAVPRPSLLQAAFDKDRHRFNSVFSQMAEVMEERGVRFSSLDIQRDEDNKGRFTAKMGLFDEQGREATLILKTGDNNNATRPKRGFSISSEWPEPGKPSNTLYLFEGGDERMIPGHWARNPDDLEHFTDRIKKDIVPYAYAFDHGEHHAGLALHLAEKTLKGFKCEVDPQGYESDRRAEADAFRARTNVNTRKHYRPGEQQP